MLDGTGVLDGTVEQRTVPADIGAEKYGGRSPHPIPILRYVIAAAECPAAIIGGVCCDAVAHRPAPTGPEHAIDVDESDPLGVGLPPGELARCRDALAVELHDANAIRVTVTPCRKQHGRPVVRSVIDHQDREGAAVGLADERTHAAIDVLGAVPNANANGEVHAARQRQVRWRMRSVRSVAEAATIAAIPIVTGPGQRRHKSSSPSRNSL